MSDQNPRPRIKASLRGSNSEADDPIVRILRPSLDDDVRQTVLRGLLALETLDNLMVDHYQRERLPTGSCREIVRALDMGRRLPDIELGMRGGRWRMEDDRSVLHFGTDARWERERFHALNLFQAKVSPSILLRNMKDESPFVATCYGLTKSTRDFTMYGRVCWSQNMSRGELVTALTFSQVALLMHAHIGGGLRTKVSEIPPAGARLVEKLGLPAARANIITFWELVDAAWGIRAIQIKGGAPHLRTQFLRILARVLSDHSDFWADDRRLTVPADLRRKFSSFPVNDPEVARLAGASGQASEALYFLMMRHLNSGKRTRRLTSREGVMVRGSVLDDDDDELAAGA